jgi:signal transduction histidine kinase
VADASPFARANEADKLVVEACDTGIGVAQEDLSRIFDAFVQTDDAMGAGFGGLASGSRFQRFLMREQGGRIWATSEGRGHGSTFHIEIPLAAGQGQRN